MPKPTSIALVAGGYPPDLDGIGDHTFWLAKALADRADVSAPVTVYTRWGACHETSGVRTVPFFDFARPSTFKSLVPLVAQDKPRWIVLQYNPFCWGARGFCPALPGTLRDLKMLPSAPKVAVVFHEIFMERDGWKSALMQLWQKRFTKQIASVAALRIASCETYADWLNSRGYASLALPVGSNLPNIAAGNRGADSQGLLVGSFGTPHPSRRIDLMAAALTKLRAAGIDARFTFIGSGGERARAVFEAKGVPFRATGPLNSELAALEMRKLDLFLAPFVDGLSGRRASAIAALQAGIPTVSTLGRATDPFLRKEDGCALILAKSDEEFLVAVQTLAADEARRNRMGADGRRLYMRYLDWPVLASRLIQLCADMDGQ